VYEAFQIMLLNITLLVSSRGCSSPRDLTLRPTQREGQDPNGGIVFLTVFYDRMHEWSTPSALGKFGLTPILRSSLRPNRPAVLPRRYPHEQWNRCARAPPQFECNPTISMNEVKLRNCKFGRICDQLISRCPSASGSRITVLAELRGHGI